MRMQLKPQDIVVLLKLVGLEEGWNYRSLAQQLFMSVGERIMLWTVRRARSCSMLSSGVRGCKRLRNFWSMVSNMHFLQSPVHLRGAHLPLMLHHL